MSIPNTRRTGKFAPTHPGEMLSGGLHAGLWAVGIEYCEGPGGVASDGERVVTGKALLSALKWRCELSQLVCRETPRTFWLNAQRAIRSMGAQQGQRGKNCEENYHL